MAPNAEYADKDYAVFYGQNKTLLPEPSTSLNETPDFIWSLKQEPHASRRKEILKAHPEIQKLFGYEPLTKYIVLAIVGIQLGCAYYFRSLDSWRSPAFWLCAYFVGGTINQALFLAIHELTHNLGFKTIRDNKLFSIMVANLPIGIPYAASFKAYHIEHHKYQGVDGIDTDLPTKAEAILFQSMLGKLFFATFQILFYALRPMIVRYQKPTYYHLLNLLWQVAFDAAIIYTFGFGPIVYFLASTLIAGSGLHPCAAHFIAEHYVFVGDWETYSYYGILNALCFNVGYHNEHHDFPNIPWSRLAQLKKIAPEFYDHLPYHKSWPLVTIKFVLDSNVSVWNRVKRQTSNTKTAGLSKNEVLQSVEECEKEFAKPTTANAVLSDSAIADRLRTRSKSAKFGEISTR